ncbi:hypothetical protein Tco_0401172 [Tanacetum coccineum]
MAQSGTDLKMAKLTKSSPIHLTSGIEDAFSSNFQTLSRLLRTMSQLHRIMQAFYAEKSPIPPPTIIPQSSMLNLKNSFFPEEEYSPPRETEGCDVHPHLILPTSRLEIGEKLFVRTSLETSRGAN